MTVVYRTEHFDWWFFNEHHFICKIMTVAVFLFEAAWFQVGSLKKDTNKKSCARTEFQCYFIKSKPFKSHFENQMESERPSTCTYSYFSVHKGLIVTNPQCITNECCSYFLLFIVLLLVIATLLCDPG